MEDLFSSTNQGFSGSMWIVFQGVTGFCSVKSIRVDPSYIEIRVSKSVAFVLETSNNGNPELSKAMVCSVNGTYK